MTDRIQQEKLIAAVERLVAGEHLTPDEDPELMKLLSLAAELDSRGPSPSEGFTQQLDNRLRELQGEAAAVPVTAAIKRGKYHHWLPGWLTLPRAGAVMAALVIGLGAIGLTGALIKGRGTLETAGSSPSGLVTESDRTASGSDALSPQNATGQAGTGDLGSGEAALPGASDSSVADNQGGAGSVAALPATPRVIQTADYEIQVATGDFQDRYNQVTALAARYGGYVVTANTRKTGEEKPLSGNITIRVANTGDNFTRAQTELDAMGTVVRKDISGQDVTQDYVDLESRLRNAQAQETQLLALMQKAQTIDEILMVQTRLADIQSQIEQLKGRLQYMDSRTDFASISIYLHETAAGDSTAGGGTDWGFVDAIEYAGWLAVQTVNFVIVALGIIIPAGLIAGLLFVVAYRVWRRRR